VSLTVRGITVLPATRHNKWAHPAATPAKQASTRFTYPEGTEGWVELLHATRHRWTMSVCN